MKLEYHHKLDCRVNTVAVSQRMCKYVPIFEHMCKYKYKRVIDIREGKKISGSMKIWDITQYLCPH